MGPFISVVMPIYQVEEYIKDSINSIISQTYIDFELTDKRICVKQYVGLLEKQTIIKDN